MTARLLKIAGRETWFRRTVRRLGIALSRLPKNRQHEALGSSGRDRTIGRSVGADFHLDALLEPSTAADAGNGQRP